MHRVWDGAIIERVDTTEEFWIADLATLGTPENRTAWMTGTPKIGPRSRSWPHARLIRTRRQANGSSQGRSLVMSTTPRMFRSLGRGLCKLELDATITTARA